MYIHNVHGPKVIYTKKWRAKCLRFIIIITILSSIDSSGVNGRSTRFVKVPPQMSMVIADYYYPD